jgi:hypothetical protein
MVKMKLDQKILEEIKRYNSINQYIMEQDVPPAEPPLPEPAGADAALPPPPGGDVPPPPAAPEAGPTPIDTATDPEVEEVGVEDSTTTEEGGEEETEEIDITDLIDNQKTMSDKQEEYFNNLFGQLEDLQGKLGEMDQLVQKLNSIEAKVDSYKPKTPEEKLELRSLDSGPFKQKLSDFFEDKMVEMEKSGKNEYVLTSDEVENYNPSDVQKSFDDGIAPFDPEIYYK